ncbi:MAG: hypothetical protein JW837_13825 [Sedimentisphaerales bacterium]|nr:hypothetical protein [Sedimentisphaerales bacterium]
MNSGLFSTNLSWWLLLLQSTIFMALGLTGSFLFKRRAARAHQALLLGVIIALLLPFMSVLVNHYGLGLLEAESSSSKGAIPESAENTLITTKTVEDNAIAEPIIADTPMLLNDEPMPSSVTLKSLPQEPSVVKIEKPTVTGDLTEKIPWTGVFMWVWGLISLALLLRLIRTFILGIRLLHTAEALDNTRITEALFTARKKLGVRQNIDIRVSPTVRSPIIWCWSFRPILLVPAGTKSLTRHADWLGLFYHEIAHLKRLDHVVGLITELAVSLIWWHPLLWWAKQRLLFLSEQACDDWVLAGGQAGPDYADLLLNLLPEGRMAFVPTIVRKEKTMKERIYRIIKHPNNNPRAGWNWTLITLIVILSVAIGTAFAQQRRPARIAHEEHSKQREEIIETIGYFESRIKETNTEIEELERTDRGRGVKANILRNEADRLRERLDGLVRELHDLDGKRDMDRPRPEQRELLKKQAEEIQRILRESEDRNPEMIKQLAKELQETHIRQSLAEFEAKLREQQMEKPQPEQRELEKRAEEIHHILRELGDREPERTKDLENELHKIHMRLDEIGAQARERQMDRPQPERQQLEKRAGEIHRILRELGDREPERAKGLENELHEIHMRLDEIGAQARERQMDRPRPKRPDLVERQILERQVLELNGQVERLSREIQEIRDLVRHLVEQKQLQL